MAKVTLPPGTADRLPRVKGRFIIKRHPSGPYASVWPRKRGKPKTPYDWYRQAEFANAAQMASNALSVQWETAKLLTDGSTLMPRDALMIASMGALLEIQLDDGTKIESGRMTSNPQYILDQVTDLPGSWLVRTTLGWERSPAPNGVPLITTLARTTDESATAGTQHTCTFQTALIDDLGIWNPATPTRLIIPPTATRIRLGFMIRTTSFTSSALFLPRFVPPPGGPEFPGRTGQRLNSTTTSSQPREFTATGTWVPNPGVEYVLLDLTTSASVTMGFAAHTTATLEAMF